MRMGPRVRWRVLAVFACLSLITLPRLSHAESPTLVVRHVSGTSYYPVIEIERVAFETDTLVVVTVSGSDDYPADEVEKIDFIWETVDVEDRDAAVALTKAFLLFQNQLILHLNPYQ